MPDLGPTAFPVLTPAELRLLRPLADARAFEGGDAGFRAGTAELDLWVVEEGGIGIRNPADRDAVITTHPPGGFAGDIDLLTGRPVIVSGHARGRTRVLRVPHRRVRALPN